MEKSWSQGALCLYEEIVTDVDFYGRENQSTLRVWSLVGWPFSGWPNIHSSVDNTYHTWWIIYLKKDMKLGGGHCAWNSQRSWQGRLREWWWSKYVISQGIKISQLGGGIAYFNPCLRRQRQVDHCKFLEPGSIEQVPGQLRIHRKTQSWKINRQQKNRYSQGK